MAPPSQPGVFQRILGNIVGKLGSKDSFPASIERIARLGMTKRQQRLNELWAVYKCQHYEHCQVDWNGKKRMDQIDKEAIASGGYIPPGFYDAGKQAEEIPLSLRYPTSPYALVPIIVNRFTGMLFSEQQHPEIQVDGDPATEDFLRQVAEEGRLWSRMMSARVYGGAVGTAVLGFQFINGKPVFEVHDPRWCTPEFEEHGSLKLVSIEKKYMFTKEVQDETTRKFETKVFWYRRLIDTQRDVVFQEIEVTEEEPNWTPRKEVQHGLGFCPVVWIHNQEAGDGEIDGEPDCDEFVYKKALTIDTLRSQAIRGTVMNCDPSIVFITKAELTDIKKGSGHALRVPEGDVKYLEITGSGIKAAMEIAAEEKKEALEQAQCVLESETANEKTATEIERRYQAMISKADKMREQYGVNGVVPLLDMVYQAAFKLAQPKAVTVAPELDSTGQAVSAELVDEAGQQIAPVQQIVRGGFNLSQREVVDSVSGLKVRQDREPGAGGTVKLKWPGYFSPTNADIEQASRAAQAAKDGGLIDDETAIKFVAPYFKAEDDPELVNKVRSQAAERDATLNAMVMGNSAVGRDTSALPGAPSNEPRIPNGADTPGLPA